MQKLLAPLLALFLTSSLHAQQKEDVLKYIQQYKDIAVEEMVRTKIPASITLAQGIVETGSGSSSLAQKANNHFGIKCKEEKKLRRHFGLAKDAKFNDAVNLLSLYHPESVQSMYILERCQQLARTSLEKEEITKALNKATILPLETPLIRTSTNTRKILDKLSAKNQKENAVPTTPEEIKYSSPSLLNPIQIKIFGLKCEMKSITDVFFFSKMCKLLDKFNNLYRLAQTEKCQKKLHEHTKSIQAAVTGAIQKIIDFNVINIFDLSVVHRLTPYKNKEGEMLLKNKFLKELKDSVDYYRKEEILRIVVLSKFE